MTPIEAQKIQDKIFQKMKSEDKLRMVDHFFELGSKLNKLNDRKIYGSNRISPKDSKDIRKD